MKKKDIKVSVYRRANRKYYQAKFRLACGEWTERSTKTTNRDEARAIGYEWAEAEMKEHASNQSRTNEVGYILEGLLHDNKHMKLDRSSLIKTYPKIIEIVSRSTMSSSLMTLGVWADKWLETHVREGSLKEETILSYSRSISVIKRIKRSKKLLMELLKEDIKEIVSDIREGNYADLRYQEGGKSIKGRVKKKPSPTTSNMRVAVLKMVLDSAYEHEYTSSDFKKFLKPLPQKKIPRGYFELWEIQRMSHKCEEVYAAGGGEKWNEMIGIIEVGLATGMRSTNCCEIDWSNIDLFKRELNIILVKQSGKEEPKISTLPITDGFYNYLMSLKPKSEGAVFPVLSSKTKTQRSVFFRERVMKRAGIEQWQTLKNGRKFKRSFHSTRGSTATYMAENGVPQEVRKDILGHLSDAMAEHYTQISEERRSKAFEALPDIRQIAQ